MVRRSRLFPRADALDAIGRRLDSVAPVIKGELMVSVKDFGATGDGVANDTAAIRAAYGAAGIGGTVHFPRGTYRVKADSNYGAALNIAKTVQITGETGSIVRLLDDAPIGSRIIQVSAADVTVRGIRFHANSIQSATCIFATGATRLLVEGNEFAQAGSGALLVNDNVTDTTFTANRVYGSGGYGILVNDNPGNARITFSGNSFNGGGGVGDAIEVNGVAATHREIIAIGNTITGYAAGGPSTGFGIGYANVTGGLIQGNTIRDCGRNGIHIECLSTDVAVIGNYVEGCGHAGIEIQGEVSKVCTHISVHSNVVRNCCLTPSINLGRGGIDVGSSTGAAFSGAGARAISISGNTVSGCRGAGIYLFQVTDSIVSDNLVSNTYGVSTDTANAVKNTGVHVISCVNTLLSSNRIMDTQSTPTQWFPIYFYGSAVGVMSVSNHNAGNLAGVTDLTSGVAAVLNSTTGSLRFDGGSGRLGFFGATPVSRPNGVPAAATDAATTQALVNDIRTKLVALGIVGT